MRRRRRGNTGVLPQATYEMVDCAIDVPSNAAHFSFSHIGPTCFKYCVDIVLCNETLNNLLNDSKTLSMTQKRCNTGDTFSMRGMEGVCHSLVGATFSQ